MEKRAWIRIDLGRFVANVRRIRRQTGKPFMATVKADCYGMGAVVISRAVEKEVDSFGVATAAEAVELRDAGIRKPILILGTILPGDAEEMVRRRVSLTVTDRALLRAISRAARKTGIPAGIHVKVDTGMGRIGIRPEDAPGFVREALALEGIRLEGIFTHFAVAEWADRAYTLMQVRRFREAVAALGDACRGISLHVANSAAVLNHPRVCRQFDCVRIGLLPFGVYPDRRLAGRLPLAPVLSGFCRVLFVKDVEAGERLSYGLTFRAPRRMRVATLGVGYADGLRRALSNRYAVVAGGRPAPIIGNICMDQTLIDVTGAAVRAGDKVTIFDRRFDVETMAQVAGTVPQEILCGFGWSRMEKEYAGGNRARS